MAGMPKLRPAKVSNPARERIFRQLFEILKSGILASHLQNVNYYWNNWNLEGGARPAKNLEFINLACERLEIANPTRKQKHLGIPDLWSLGNSDIMWNWQKSEKNTKKGK